MARSRRVVACALALSCAVALAPTHKALHRREALSGAAAAALAVVAAPAHAIDAGAAIAVERSGFAPTIKQGGTKTPLGVLGGGTSRYEDTVVGARGTKSQVNIAFEFPSDWTVFKNKVDLLDGKTGTVATVVAAPVGADDSLDSKAFYACIFSPDGKIQRAGTPVDEFKVLSVRDGVLPGYKEIALKFTAVSPNSRLIDRRAVATATRVGDRAYIFVCSAAAVKWKGQQDTVTAAARTFTAS